jgi:hypothetical protein
LYGHIATATGWTFAEIDQLTLWEVNELFDYWQDHPPTHVLVGAYLLKGQKHQRSSRGQLDELSRLVGSFGGLVGKKLPPAYTAK